MMKGHLPFVGFTIVVLEYVGFKSAIIIAMVKGFWPPEMCKTIDLILMFFAVIATLWLASLPARKSN